MHSSHRKIDLNPFLVKPSHFFNWAFDSVDHEIGKDSGGDAHHVARVDIGCEDGHTKEGIEECVRDLYDGVRNSLSL